MALNERARNAELDALARLIRYVSLHDSDPGEQGTNVVGDRKAVRWAPAHRSTLTTSAVVEFAVPAGKRVTHLGYWSAVAGGDWYGSEPLGEPQEFRTAGVYVLAAGAVVEAIAAGR